MIREPHALRTALVSLVLLAAGSRPAGAQDPAQAFFTAPENALSVSELGTPFEMLWGAHQVGDLVVERAFLVLPCSLEGIDVPLYLQFDLGAPSSVLYREAVDAVIARGANLQRPASGASSVVDLELTVGTTRVRADRLDVVPHGGSIDWEDGASRPFLGTLGADWLDGRVLVLDFPRNRIELAASVPERFREQTFEPFSFRGRRLFLPAVVDGTPGSLWFDTGSSAFELITDEETFAAMALEGAEEVVYPANSWGRPVKVHNVATRSSIVFGETTIAVEQVSTIEWPDPSMVAGLTQLLRGTDMRGMCGNRLFRRHVLVLDAAKERFWVGAARADEE